MKNLNFRRIYPFTCSGCGKRRMSMVYSRRKGEKCQICLKNKGVPGQQGLFIFGTKVTAKLNNRTLMYGELGKIAKKNRITCVPVMNSPQKRSFKRAKISVGNY